MENCNGAYLSVGGNAIGLCLLMKTKDDVEKYYKSQEPLYKRLEENLKQALVAFLDEGKISCHSISSRIKEFDSYYEKIERKRYDNPEDQIEDFCGLRIICFYPSDLEKIGKIIKREFEVVNSIDKTSNLEPDRFGYRSNHYIVKIKTEWAKAPNYRGLKNLKAEVQVRTILMHAWADIEHKLAYKKKEQIPGEFRRKLSQISALLEIADSQFQELKNEKEDLRKSLIIESKGKKNFDFSTELNLDTLQAYLDFAFPDRGKSLDSTRRLLDEIVSLNLSLKDIDQMKSEVQTIFPELEKKVVKEGRWAQVGIARMILDLKSDAYWKKRPKRWSNLSWGQVVLTERKRIKDDAK
ncbi:MAG TPA: hypothetical protein VD884_06790 [Ohtaekwangia sp.]|nr:hypothetical protein [Ohtaekwangia sp.]